jgi:hypothetical protein
MNRNNTASGGVSSMVVFQCKRGLNVLSLSGVESNS